MNKYHKQAAIILAKKLGIILLGVPILNVVIGTIVLVYLSFWSIPLFSIICIGGIVYTWLTFVPMLYSDCVRISKELESRDEKLRAEKA
jgi:hypothetical protein